MSLILLLQPNSPHKARFQELADAVAKTVTTQPAIFDGEDAQEREGALLVAVAFHESRFHVEAVGGHNENRVSLGAWQVKVQDRDWFWFTEEDLVKPLPSALAAYTMIRQSFDVCKKNVELERLNLYVSGSCSRGQKASRARVGLANRLIASIPPR